MFKRLVSIRTLLVCSVVALSACAAPYRVIPTLEPVTSSTPPVPKINEVAVRPLKDLQGQYNRPGFVVTIKNKTAQPLAVSTENIQAELNGKTVRVMSFDAQVDELMGILSRRNLSIPIYSPIYSGFHPYFVGPYRFAPHYRFAREDGFDSVDAQLAIRDLNHVRQKALRPTVLQPGQMVEGEITILDKLPAQKDQEMKVAITLGGEIHRFQFAYQQLQR